MAEPEIPSGRAEFDGFAGHYQRVIAPYLREKEGDRERAVKSYAAILGAAGLVAGAVLILRPFGEVSFQLGFVAAMIGFGGATWFLTRSRNDISHGLLERVCQCLGFSYKGELQRPVYFAEFDRLKLMPSFNRESWEDEVRGSHAGAEFVLCEADLKMKSSNGKSSSTRTVFHGQLFVIDYPKRFLGETVVKRDAGLLNRFGKPSGNFSNVGLASGEFEKAFEAWSTDQVEARDLLDPVVLERFQELERLFDGKKLRVAFTGGKLLIAIETGDRLNMGTMFKPLDQPERVSLILKEFDAIFDLIDLLIKRVDRPMDGPVTLASIRDA